MIGDGINDGKFVIKKGGLSQAIAGELGLNEQQVKQIGSIWSKIFAEVDKQQEQNLAEGKSAIYSGGNDLKGSVNENYKVFVGQAIEFSKEIWANIVKLVNDKLKTNIKVDNSSSNPTSEPTSSDATAPKSSETESTTEQAGDRVLSVDELKELFKGLNKYTPQGIAQDLIDEIFGGRANLDEIMPRINADNVLEVLDEYKKLSDEKNTKAGVLLDDETLIEAILDETIPKEKKKEYINHIKNALIEKMNRYGGNAEKFSEVFSKAIDKVLNLPTGLQSAKILNKLIDDFIVAMNKTKDLYYIRNTVKFLEDEGIDTTDIVGNGKFDNPARQMTGNCWAHAGINAMMQTEAGRAYLDKLIEIDEITGEITIYLPGADKCGLPKPNGDGKYTYSRLEIGQRAGDTSAGDGDYTAFMIAVEDFRKEYYKDADATSASGFDSEFCIMVFGTTKAMKQVSDKEKLIDSFNNGQPLYVILSAKECCTVLGYKDDGGSAHAVAIKTINAESNTAILIDSNEPNKSIEVDLDILLNNSRIFGFEIPEEVC